MGDRCLGEGRGGEEGRGLGVDVSFHSLGTADASIGGLKFKPGLLYTVYYYIRTIDYDIINLPFVDLPFLHSFDVPSPPPSPPFSLPPSPFPSSASSSIRITTFPKMSLLPHIPIRLPRAFQPHKPLPVNHGLDPTGIDRAIHLLELQSRPDQYAPHRTEDYSMRLASRAYLY